MNPARLLMIDLSGPRLTPDEREFLRDRRPGGVCLFGRNVSDRLQVADYVAELRSLAGQELLVAVDQEGGGVVRITDLAYPPSAMALGAADDVALTRAVAEATGHGLASVGIDVDFAPVADVNSNPANPVIADRAFGADPHHVARHVVAFVAGLQGAGVAATLKHFPGHGDAAIDSHLALPKLGRSLEAQELEEWPPFVAGIAAGAAAVMTAHIVLTEVEADLPSTLSRSVITGLLRGRLGFDGVVFSDALEMKAVAQRWSGPEAAVLALAAGVDMPAQVASLSVHEETVRAVKQALAEGRLDPEAMAASAARLDALIGRFGPRRKDAASAWRPGDAELLAEASRRALVGIGDLPRLCAGAKVVLVAAGASRQSAATQATVSPAEGLAAALRERRVEVQELSYQRESLAVDSEPVSAALSPSPSAVGVSPAQLAAADLVIFASTTRTALTTGETELARELASCGAPFLHVALWNPYVVDAVPGPALVTFGWRERSVAAAANALLGVSPVTGVAPVPLRPAPAARPVR